MDAWGWERPALRRVEVFGLALRGFARCNLAIKSLQQPGLYVIRNLLRLNALIDLQCLLRRIDDDKAIGTFSHVRLKPALHLRVRIWIEIIVQFLKELFTSEQVRLPLSV